MFKRASLAAAKLILVTSLSLPAICYADDNMAGGMPPTVVAIAPVKVTIWQNNITAIGTLAANQGIVVKPEIEGRVSGIFFHSGDSVKAGAPLIQLNSDIMQAEYAQAAAKAKLAKSNYTRAIALYNKHVFAKAELDNAFANFQADKADADKARAMLNQALLRAPFSGRLGLRQVDVGDYVTSGQAIVNLQSIDPMRINFSVPESAIDEIAIGQTALVTSRSFSDKTFKGKIYAIDSLIDANTRTLGVRAVVANQQQKLMPGGFVDIKLLTGKAQKTIIIPQTALSYAGDEQYVYKVIDGKAVKTKVLTGTRKDDDIAVLSGLKAGDTIITAGQMKVQDGQAVMAAPPAQP